MQQYRGFLSFLENLHGGNMPGLNLSTKWFVIYKVKVRLDMEEYNLEVTELSNRAILRMEKCIKIR